MVGRAPGATDGPPQLAVGLKATALQRIVKLRGAAGLGVRGQLLQGKAMEENAMERIGGLMMVYMDDIWMIYG